MITAIATVNPGRVLRVTGDGFDAQGPRRVRIDGEARVTCAGPGGTGSAVHSTYLLEELQPGGIGSVVDVMLGAALEVNVPAGRTRCLAGMTARRIDGWFQVTVASFGGGEVRTPRQGFNAVY